MAARRKSTARRAEPIIWLDDGVLGATIRATRAGSEREIESGIDQLTTAPADEVDVTLDGATDRILAALYTRGWQPADVIRAVDPAHRARAAAMIRRHMRAYPADRVGERWVAQLDALDADPAPTDRHDAIRAAVEVLGILSYLPELPVLMPPPGVARVTIHPATPADSRMLGKIRALLAKAESTTFPGEADSYSAKAQQLMARHRIDHARLAGETVDPTAPVGVRLTVEDPYADAKALLLQVVAAANGCRAVWSAEYGFSTVFGFADELEVVELLYTSLLVQGSAAMVREGSARHDGPARTRTFRQSFMHGYAIRIGDRLRDVADETNAAATASTDGLLPVLVRRDQAVGETVDRIFPRVASKGRSVRVDSEAGWRSGTAFADRASLRD